MLNLLMAPKNEVLSILKLKEHKMGGENQVRHLKNLGFVEGAKIEIVSEASGNLIVKVKDSKLAIGHDIARNIYIA